MDRSFKTGKSSFFFFVLFSVFLSFPVNGGIVFSDLDLAETGNENRLLFRAGTGAVNGTAAVQDALFMARLPALSGAAQRYTYTLQQFTAFPEKIDLLENGRTLQVRNAFGAVRLPYSGGLPESIPGFPSFAGGNPAESGRPEEMAPSGDGRWLLYLDPVSPALGNLIMIDVLSGKKTLVASGLERPEKIFPATWSPDSRFFIYGQGEKLYYCMNGSVSMPGDERTRLIGEGTVNSIAWGANPLGANSAGVSSIGMGARGDFYFLRGSTLFHVRGPELSARAFYADFLEIGSVAGKLPFEFDPCFDSFWIAPDAQSILVSKSRRTLFFFPLDQNQNTAPAETTFPYLMLPRSSAGIKVLWSNTGIITVIVSIPSRTGTEVKMWRLKLSDGGKGAVFDPLPPPKFGNVSGSFPGGILSPDGNLVLLWGAKGILLYDYADWKFLDMLSLRPASECLWVSNEELVIGDDQKIEKIRVGSKRVLRREMICLSRSSESGFDENTGHVLAKSGDAWFFTDGRIPWTPVSNPHIRKSSQVTSQFRVYLEKQTSGMYANLPMLRNISSVGTFPLFPPVSGLNIPFAGFREAAVCFDLYDDDQGLPEILDALNRFDIRATFFLNGEFLRRHPEAASEIVAAGHEAASMFFAPIDLSDGRYRADADFITRGLARNEDEFFRTTGKELALLWHPPWYSVSPDIASAAVRAGYTMCRRDIDPLDWVSRDDEQKLGLQQLSPSAMIDRIMEAVKPGSVIPIRLGLLSGGRNDYLFNRISLLLDALVRENYTLTTVSALLEHSR